MNDPMYKEWTISKREFSNHW